MPSLSLENFKPAARFTNENCENYIIYVSRYCCKYVGVWIPSDCAKNETLFEVSFRNILWNPA